MLKRPSRTTVFTATATALSLLGDQALYALLPLYFQEIGLLPIQVGILLSANRWIRLLTNHLAERLAERFPVNLMLVLSLTLGALLSLAYAYFSSFLVLLVARCLWGLCWSFIRHISDGRGLINKISEPGSDDGLLQWHFSHWQCNRHCPRRDTI